MLVTALSRDVGYGNSFKVTLGQGQGFGIFMLKAVISGRGDELIYLAKVNLFR